jgi:hypothetical protein
MTRQRSFKRLVRARMDKTGESYTAARANLLTADKSDGPVLATSDEKIRQRTGRGWEEWFSLLDEWGAQERTHREIARWVAEQQGVVPLAWNAQAVAGSYELARGLREVGEKDDGFAITATKTVAVPVERLYDGFLEANEKLRERTATRPKSARFDWTDGESRVNVTFLAKGETKSTVALEHRRLPDAATADQMKTYWRDHLTTLKSQLERGERDA